ncbi:MAG: hypothetical protein KKC79_08340 [Gammaproteobacteria bacterium]|nr:hypothetical protein [Gammaproteobacteria bacterium]MBU1440982.1 hypothetical protein [Gammaproteobacteria bacterium]MBU2287536.1 hypothetical protein [Gammaproteobacteria bacterium]MBU2408642.1 hypothetical protein [Gammaproteobacteria bacterium]
MRSSKLMMPDHRDHYLLFGSSWNGAGVRLKSTARHASDFRMLFDGGTDVPSDTHFEQDATLFDTVANATAAAENVLFAAYLLAVFPSVPSPFRKALKQPRDQMIERVLGASRTHRLGEFLGDSFDKKAASMLYELRDFLLHRGRLSRNHFVGGPFSGKMTVARNAKSHSSEWENDLVFGETLLDEPLDWLKEHCDGAGRLMCNAMPE